MKKELSIKQIYDDFTSKVILTDNEQDILVRYIRNDGIVKIANDTKQGTTTVSRVIYDIKDKYKRYKELELAKLKVFKHEN